jgi:hypothetical protein
VKPRPRLQSKSDGGKVGMHFLLVSPHLLRGNDDIAEQT